MSNLNDELLAAGYTPVPLMIEGTEIELIGWIAPRSFTNNDVDRDDVYCTVCGCEATYGPSACGGPTFRSWDGIVPNTDDLQRARFLCAHWDDEQGEFDCVLR